MRRPRWADPWIVGMVGVAWLVVAVAALISPAVPAWVVVGLAVVGLGVGWWVRAVLRRADPS